MPLIENHLIEKLPGKDRRRLLSACTQVPLVLAQALSDPGEPTRYVYFPTEGFISLITQIKGHPGLEVGMVGCEGMLGVHVALGIVTAPLHAVVQGTGMAWRCSTRSLRSELALSAALQRSMQRYLYVLMAQLAESAACLRFHAIGPRLARWLLMSQDRARADSFRMTHEFLAYMLGVRRVGITAAAGVLQRNGLIEYHQGKLTVLNRKGLEHAACSCYAADRKVYTKHLG